MRKQDPILVADITNTKEANGRRDNIRFGELNKLLPVTAVICIIVFFYLMYVFLHCLRLLQLGMPTNLRMMDKVQRGKTELAVFHTLSGLVFYCLARCVLTLPGTIPDGRGWDMRFEKNDDGADSGSSGGGPKRVSLIETKESGARRHCKWCLKYKPDRCHHCRICNLCVLRMDHHCPWVYNCIGFRNHKYFVLLLIYAAADLSFMVATMLDTVWWSTRTDVSVMLMLTLACGELLATLLLFSTVTFLGFHLWLMVKAITTVEFCEKSLKKVGYDSSIYNQGLYKNICEVLGPQPLFWLLPIWLPSGDGLTFHSSSRD